MVSAMVAQFRVTSAVGFLLLLGSPGFAAGPDDDVEWDGVFSDTTAQFVSPRSFEGGDTVTLSLRAKANDLTGATCRVFFAPNGEASVPMSKDATRSNSAFDYWTCDVDVPQGTGEVYYRFLVTDGADTDAYDAGAPGDPWNVRGMQDEERSFFDFRLYAGFAVPEWSEGAIFYQVFPDRFANGRGDNDRVLPDDCLWYLDFAPATPEAEACRGFTVPETPAGYAKRCAVHEDWNGTPNGGPCDFFGGDLVGIQQRLDYLEDLGATALYLNPIFRSPSNHKYDTTDYSEIDPRFGTLEELDTLTRDLHARDMRIIVDGVFNHVSDLGNLYGVWSNYAFDSAANTASGIDGFEEQCGAWEQAFLSQTNTTGQCTSPYADWFRLWVGQDTWDVDRDGDTSEPYAHTCGWAGLGFMPELDFKDPNVAPDSGPRTWLYGGSRASDPAVARQTLAARWLADGEVLTEGLDGWRLDVPDNAGYFTAATGCDKAAADPTIWQGFREAVKTAGEDKYISGEIWTDAASVGGLAGDWFRARTYDAVMNYHFFGTPVSCYLTGKGVHDDAGECNVVDAVRAGNPGALSALVSHLAESRRLYPSGAYLSSQNLISSHDSSRFASRVGGGQTAVDMMRLVNLMQVTLPGAAMIYYGDEIATEGANNELGRATFDWRVFEQPDSPRVGLWETVRKHACTRNNLPALRTGSMQTLLVDDARGVWAFSRFTADQQAVVVLNTSDRAASVSVPLGLADLPAGELVDVLTGETYAPTAGAVSVDLAGRAGAVLVPSSQASATDVCSAEANLPPVADAGEDVVAFAGEKVRLDGGASVDPEGAPLRFRWTSADGGGFGTGSFIDVTLVTPGEHVFRLTVSDGVHSSSDEVTITIMARPDPMDPNDNNNGAVDPNDNNNNNDNDGGSGSGAPPASSGCAATGPAASGLLLLAPALLLGLRRRRR